MANDFNFDVGQVDFGGGADIDSFLTSVSGNEGTHTSNSILQTILPSGPFSNYEIGGPNGLQTQGSSGIDAIFARNELRASHNRKADLSVSDLNGFTRISAETLVHKSNAELWTLRKEADGKFYIERLFDDNGEPLKG